MLAIAGLVLWVWLIWQRVERVRAVAANRLLPRDFKTAYLAGSVVEAVAITVILLSLVAAA